LFLELITPNTNMPPRVTHFLNLICRNWSICQQDLTQIKTTLEIQEEKDHQNLVKNEKLQIVHYFTRSCEKYIPFTWVPSDYTAE